jgi:hypothetical protein
MPGENDRDVLVDWLGMDDEELNELVADGHL